MTEPFIEEKLEIIRNRHKALLLQVKESEEADLDQIRIFLEILAQAGVTVQDAEERSLLHELIRYWASFVSEKTGVFPVIQLQPFDEVSQTKPKLRISRRSLISLGTVGVAVAASAGAASLYFRQASNNTITVNFVYSSEKEGWITPAVNEFNNSPSSINGKRIIVEVLGSLGTLDAVQEILNGTIRPTIWGPASSLVLQ